MGWGVRENERLNLGLDTHENDLKRWRLHERDMGVAERWLQDLIDKLLNVSVFEIFSCASN